MLHLFEYGFTPFTRHSWVSFFLSRFSITESLECLLYLTPQTAHDVWFELCSSGQEVTLKPCFLTYSRTKPVMALSFPITKYLHFRQSSFQNLFHKLNIAANVGHLSCSAINFKSVPSGPSVVSCFFTFLSSIRIINITVLHVTVIVA